MKRLFTLCAIVVAVVVSSCSKFDDTDIWDKLNDHEKRITALEELCKQMNTNITALQTIVEALEKNDYITNVSPVRKDGEVIGYTITFAHSDTITIYNGEDGTDGYVPNICVMKDVDGIYYWTIDGEWLLDGKGNKIQANGIDGGDGIDGITPRLKIENDYWYVSYDNGVTWVELGKATGEDGSNGIDGTDGDSIFSSVTQDDEYVYFNLVDGLSIIIKKQNNDSIIFEDIKVRAICCRKWDTNCDNQLSYSEAKNVTDISDVFNGNTEIIAFEELKYFTSLTSIPDNAFNGCKSLSIINMPNSITHIGNGAFKDCTSLYTIEIPENVTSIEDNAFYNCTNLVNIIIPKSLAFIGSSAFYQNYQTQRNIYISDLTNWCKIEFKSQPLSGGGNLYIDGKLINDLEIPSDITTISSGAFSGCASIVNLTIGNNINTIGDFAFANCYNLLNISIASNVTKLGDSAFQSCTNLTSITIPSSVTHIGCRAFCFCEKLKYVYCKAIIPPTTVSYDAYGWECFSGCSSGLKIYVPLDYSPEYKNANGWKSYKNYIYEYDFENNVAM